MLIGPGGGVQTGFDADVGVIDVARFLELCPCKGAREILLKELRRRVRGAIPDDLTGRDGISGIQHWVGAVGINGRVALCQLSGSRGDQDDRCEITTVAEWITKSIELNECDLVTLRYLVELPRKRDSYYAKPKNLPRAYPPLGLG